MLEKEIEKRVCDYARAKYGALCYKFTSPARRSVPDRELVFPSGLICFIEFKAPGKAPTSAQEREIQRLREYRQHVMVCNDEELGKRAIDALVESLS